MRKCKKLIYKISKNELINIKLIRSPYLVQPENKADYLNQLFSKAAKNKKVEIENKAEDVPNFIDVRDLATFVYRLFDNLQDSQEISIFNLRPYQNQSYKDLKVRMLDYFPDTAIDFVEKTGGDKLQLGDDNAKKEYSWQAKYGLIRNRMNLEKHFKIRKENYEVTCTLFAEKS